jgi:hypothetical protein
MYILLFISLTGAPAQLGTFSGLESCTKAIRTMYEVKMYLPGSPKNPEIEKAIDIQLQYQRQYKCVPQ